MGRKFRGRKSRTYAFFFWGLMLLISLGINKGLLRVITVDYVLNGKILSSKVIKLDKERILLSLGLNYYSKPNIEDDESDIPVFNEIEITKPKIYLYNTHQSEEYYDSDVFKVSKILRDKLESSGAEVILEDTNISSILKENKLIYKDSYKVTRKLLSSVISDEISLYIDIHRDSSKKKITTVQFNNKSYAKVMFVVGGKHSTYKKNYQVCEDLNKLIKNVNKGLSRGIYVRSSSSYNQDLSSNVILIELGGVDNTLEEVSNTIDILSEILINYVNE